MKNEATDLIDNKGSAVAGIWNEPTVWVQKAVDRRQAVKGQLAKVRRPQGPEES
ncbi:MAG TPA: hypothetical protein VKM93_17475 [Terriglobia bacterium]|nr:hypothetical protein [Terriglobia bacterium]